MRFGDFGGGLSYSKGGKVARTRMFIEDFDRNAAAEQNSKKD